MAASIFNGSAVKILKNILRFNDGTEISSADAANLSGLDSNVQDQLDAKVDDSEKGANNGVATLDGSGKVPVSQLPSAVMSYLGTWAADTNTPTLADGTGDAGDVYVVSVAGTQDLGSGNISFSAGDWVMYNGTIWEKSASSSAVVSVNGQSGVVALTTDDVPEGAALYFADELAQDAVGNILAGTATIDTNYDDITPEISFSVAPSSLTDTHVATGANIVRSKLAAGNSNRVVVNDGSGVMIDAAVITANRALTSSAAGIPVASTVTDTELGHVSGVTSAIQTQLNGKEPTITTLPVSKGGTNSGTSLNNNRVMQSSGGAIVEAAAITASRALESDANGIPVASAVTATELGYVSGVTSALQTQIANKVSGPSMSLVQGDNATAYASVGSWATYADAAAAQPVDGTGGSPVVTLTRTTVSAEVLNGAASFLFTKDAANRQGEGASLDMTVPNYAKGQPMAVRFNLSASANFDFGTAFSSADPSDITVYLYDVTNSALLQPYPYTLFANGQYEGMFQIPVTCASLRLILHVTTTNALAYTLSLDDFEIVPARNETVAADSDWQAYTPTFTGLGTVSSVNFFYRKNGPNLQVMGRATCGVTTATEMRVSFPTGLTTISGLGTTQVAGAITDSRATANAPSVLIESSVSYFTFGYKSSGGSALTKITGSGVYSTGEIISFFAEAQILGWTSGQVTAASANLNAPVVFRAYKNSGAVSANTDIPSWTVVNKDSVNGFNSTTGVYTIKVPGDYYADVRFQQTANTTGVAVILVNGTAVIFGEQALSSSSKHASTILTDLKVGDTVSVQLAVAATLNPTNTQNVFCLHKIETSNRVYATRVAYIKDVKAANTAGQSITSGSFVTQNLNTFEGDTSFVSVASNQFTLQPGTYQIYATIPCAGSASNPLAVKQRLRNITAGTTSIVGTTTYLAGSATPTITGVIMGVVSVSVASIFEVQTRRESGTGNVPAANLGEVEVYTQVKIEKVL